VIYNKKAFLKKGEIIVEENSIVNKNAKSILKFGEVSFVGYDLVFKDDP